MSSTPAAHTPPPTDTAIDRLHRAITASGVPACVGLDPVYEKLPDSLRTGSAPPTHSTVAVMKFCMEVLEAVRPHVGILKPQSACFERLAGGMQLLTALTQYAHRLGYVVILDAKRGDIGISAEHYAAAAFGGAGIGGDAQDAIAREGEKAGAGQNSAEFITVNPYLGFDTIEPFLARPQHGAFALVRTSNPGSDAIQSQRLADGRTVAELIADGVHTLGAKHRGACGLSNLGAVVGATKSSEGEALRKRMPDTVFLVPGYGAQGGTLDDLRPLLRTRASAADAGIVVNASRSVLYPDKRGADWKHDIAQAAARFAEEIRSLTN